MKRRIANRGRFYGADPTKGPKQLSEALEVIKKGLTSNILNHKGEL